MAKNLDQPRILTLDVETSPLESYHWRLWDEHISVDQVNVEWSILSYCAKWLDAPKLIYEDTGGRGKHRVRDDKGLLKSLWSLLDEADLVVAQNGNSFDIKKINSRLVMHGFAPYKPVRVIDTFLAAKRFFSFTSNKLAWLSKHLTNEPKDPHKQFPGFELWAEVLKDNPKAWAEMQKYNKRDVVATEKLYKRLRPWIRNHPNLGMYDLTDRPVCTNCGSARLQSRGTQVTQQGRYDRYQCQECGAWARGKRMNTAPRIRMSKLAPI